MQKIASLGSEMLSATMAIHGKLFWVYGLVLDGLRRL